MLLDFIKENILFLIILFATIILIIVAYFIVTRKDSRPINTIESDPDTEAKDTEKDLDISDDADMFDDSNTNAHTEDMPTIITSFADTHEEVAGLDEISSNLNRDGIDNKEKAVRKSQPVVDDDFDQEEDMSIFDKKPKPKLSGDDFAFLYNEEKDLDTEKNPNKRYHVLYLKEENRWFVKREGRDRVLKTFETQKEAIAFATIKSLENETSVVVHKRDGKIRKYSL